MKKILVFFIVCYAIALTKQEIYYMYQQKKFKKTCYNGISLIYKYKEDENFKSIVALSCVNADMINAAIKISKSMTKTKIGRHNASYIGSLFLIKKLLLQVVWDNIDISNLSLPTSSHILSIVFENISHKNFIKSNNEYIIKANKKEYHLSKYGNYKFIIKIYQNNILINKHIYW